MDLFDGSDKKPKQQRHRQEAISQRTRTHARTLMARIYLISNAVLLVRAEPDSDLLQKHLCGKAESKQKDIPTPAQLGFANSNVIPLNRGGLASRSRSVQLWRHWVEKRISGRTNASELRELKAEAHTLQSLGDRVAALHNLLSETKPESSPFWLDPTVEKPFLEVMQRRFAGLHIPVEVSDIARMICWIRGLDGAVRFIESVRVGLLTVTQYEQRILIERFRDTLIRMITIRNSLKESAEAQKKAEFGKFLHRLAEEGLFRDLREAFAALPDQIQIQSHIELPKNDAEIDFKEISCKSLKLNSSIFKKLQKRLPEIEFSEIQKTFLKFQSIIINANDQLQQIESDDERRKLAIMARFRSQARELGDFDRLRKSFEALPSMAKSPDRIYLPSRERDINLELTLHRTNETLNSLPQIQSIFSLNWLAVFCLTDNSKTPIPWGETFTLRTEYNIYLYELWKTRFQPGYEQVLENFNDIAPDWELEEARQFLGTGASMEDLEWFTEHDVYRDYDSRYGAAAKPFRKIVEWLQKHDAEFTDNDIDTFWKSIASEAGCALIESLARFLSWMRGPSLQQVGEITGLIRTFSDPSLSKPLIDRLRSWANPPARSRLPAGYPDNLPGEITPEIRRLAFYQRMAGQQARIPGSIRSILGTRSRQIAETEHLKKLGAEATRSQLLRLEHLENKLNESEICDTRSKERILRQIREVTVLTALSAAKAIIRNEISRCWISQLGFEPEINSLSWQQQLKFISWVDKLETDSKESVIAVMRAHQQYGPGYRRALPKNSDWLKRANQSIHIDSWLDPPTMHIQLDGERVMIKAANHPLDIYLMGTRFDTCLSLQDGCNNSSVITNAADANKAVLYAWRNDGTPIARKLVGIRTDWKMVGYRLYSHDTSEALSKAFACYCGKWAAKAGLGLANWGSPPVISGGFWYNDVSVPWTDDTYSAYQEIQQETTLKPDLNRKSGLKQLHQALEKRQETKLESQAELELLGQYRPTVATFWSIRAEWVSSEKNTLLTNTKNDFRTLGYHLTAAGLVKKFPNPYQISLGNWSELVWSVMALIPLEKEMISTIFDQLMQIPPNPEKIHFRSCFATCRISPAFGVLSFQKIIRLLRRYSEFYGALNCGCGAEAWKMWAQVLRTAWIRDPDPVAFADAFSDIDTIVSAVMEMFCRICPDRRFSGPIRRQLRSITETTRQEKLQELRNLVHAIAANPIKEQKATSLQSIIFDLKIEIDVRLKALIELANQSQKTDAIIGVLLCTSWTAEQRGMIPIEIRQAFALEMFTQATFDEWKTWPLIYWLATLPEQNQRDLHLKMIAEKNQVFQSYKDCELAWCVITHALENTDHLICNAAEMFFCMYATRNPESVHKLSKHAGLWIWPSTYQRLKSRLHEIQ